MLRYIDYNMCLICPDIRMKISGIKSAKFQTLCTVKKRAELLLSIRLVPLKAEFLCYVCSVS
jgi:hypothetical protein